MNKFICGFICGGAAVGLFHAFSLAWSRRWYPVKLYVPGDNLFVFSKNMGDAVGYSKLSLPEKVDVEKIEVRIKHFNPKKSMYHIFWRLKK